MSGFTDKSRPLLTSSTLFYRQCLERYQRRRYLPPPTHTRTLAWYTNQSPCSRATNHVTFCHDRLKYNALTTGRQIAYNARMIYVYCNRYVLESSFPSTLQTHTSLWHTFLSSDTRNRIPRQLIMRKFRFKEMLFMLKGSSKKRLTFLQCYRYEWQTWHSGETSPLAKCSKKCTLFCRMDQSCYKREA